MIADDVWAKLLWARSEPRPGRSHNESSAQSCYPIELVRALSVTWLCGGLRSDENLLTCDPSFPRLPRAFRALASVPSRTIRISDGRSLEAAPVGSASSESGTITVKTALRPVRPYDSLIRKIRLLRRRDGGPWGAHCRNSGVRRWLFGITDLPVRPNDGLSTESGQLQILVCDVSATRTPSR